MFLKMVSNKFIIEFQIKLRKYEFSREKFKLHAKLAGEVWDDSDCVSSSYWSSR